jgi:hypothetical protein
MHSLHRLFAHRLALASGALILVVVTSCAAVRTPRDVVVLWSANDQWVKIEPQDNPAAPPNDHPAPLTTEAISTALAALQVRIVDEDAVTEMQRSVFTREEVRNLAPQVASGLAKAGPRQDVTFSTIGSHPLSSGGGLIKDVGVNAGRVFYTNGKLNVIFGELQSNYRKKNIYGQRTDDYTARRQGSRDRVAKQKWALAPNPGVEFHSIDGGVRNDWVAIDSTAVASQASAAPQPDKTTGPQPASAPAMPAASLEKSEAKQPSPDMEQRLRTLKDLRDKGLISEEAYRAKMQEVLSEL